MAQKIDEVTMAALDLSIEERAFLAGKLLLSLDDPSEEDKDKTNQGTVNPKNGLKNGLSQSDTSCQ